MDILIEFVYDMRILWDLKELVYLNLICEYLRWIFIENSIFTCDEDLLKIPYSLPDDYMYPLLCP